jgi:sulfatase maturation enzyme AslB (radical SAM superfamily)
MIDSYSGRKVIVRSSSASEIVDSLKRADSSAIRFIQLLSASSDASVLEGFGESIPLEIVLKDPASQFQNLYRFKNLLDSHPVRIAIPVVNGFSKAARLAVSLNFAVKLEMEQPDDFLITEIESVLDFYLHRSYVRQPIEFFQTILLSLYRNEPASLWEIAEEEPAQLRYVTDDGEETISRRFAGIKLKGGLSDFVNRFGQDLITERRECHDCEFFNRCGGYFKWPDKSYRCDGIRRIFRTLVSAAHDVQHDLASYEEVGVQQQQ